MTQTRARILMLQPTNRKQKLGALDCGLAQMNRMSISTCRSLLDDSATQTMMFRCPLLQRSSGFSRTRNFPKLQELLVTFFTSVCDRNFHETTLVADSSPSIFNPFPVSLLGEQRKKNFGSEVSRLPKLLDSLNRNADRDVFCRRARGKLDSTTPFIKARHAAL